MHTPIAPEKRHWTDSVGLHLPVGIVLALLLASNWMELDAVSRKHQQLETAGKMLESDAGKKQLSNAQSASQKLEALIKEVATLAPTNANARKIADEFRIPVEAAPDAQAPVDAGKEAVPTGGQATAAASAPAAKH